MSLARAFVRLTALEALCPSALLVAQSPAWPTQAGDFVFDSKIDPLDRIEDDDKHATISVYTEDSVLTRIAQAPPNFYKGEVDLVFESAIVQRFAGEGGAVIVDYCDTDAACEATLDSLEDQIKFALHFADSGRLFRQMVKLPFTEWHSTVKRAGEENVRFAARTVRGKIQIKEACLVDLPTGHEAGFDRLPPALKAIAQQLGDSTYLHDLALGMARVAPQLPVRPPLQTVGLAVNRQINPQSLAAGEATNLQGNSP